MMRRLLVTCLLVYTIGVQAAPSNPLRIQTRTQWPASIDTVKKAAYWLLSTTGYALVVYTPAAPDCERIVARPISSAALDSREVMPIEDALLLIAGSDTVLYVDHEHKLVAFGYRQGEQ